LIEEALQQATTTLAATASPLDFKTELSFWFTIIGSGLGFILGGIKLWESWTSRTGRWLNLLAPKLREIRALINSQKFVEADKLYHQEVHGKGFEPALRKISRDTALPELFFRLSYLAAFNDSHLLKEKIKDREASVMLTVMLADTASKIVAGIDRILDKAVGA
jgi:hypothetical protein